MIPLSLYIHIPWCLKKCPYCDFNSHAVSEHVETPYQDYTKRLLQDFREAQPSLNNRPIHSIFFGGGTPSLMPPECIAELLQTIGSEHPIVPNAEITLEANPSTAESERFKNFKRAGVNRLSIGVQSLNPVFLKKLGRTHNPQDAKLAFQYAVDAGFEEINLDLMFGLPEQTLDQALEDLSTAIALKPTHLSWYELTIEPNTFFHHHPPKLPSSDAVFEQSQAGRSLLAAHGFKQYEISAYTRSRVSKHNMNYWQFGDYLGIGAGAHSKLSFEDGTIERSMRFKNPKDYLNLDKPLIQERASITENARAFEFMLNALRLMEDIPFELFESRTFLSRDVLTSALTEACDRKLMVINNDAIQLTELGKNFHNDLVQLFL